MRKIALFVTSILISGFVLSCSNEGEQKCTAPKLCKMKCEFVPDSGEAVIYGRNLANAEVIFPGDKVAEVIADKSNDSVLTVIVPMGTKEGKITVKNNGAETKSSFIFRDARNTIVNFDRRLATWGGYSPMDEEGELISGTLEYGEEITPFPNGATLPEPCDGNYGFLYGKYKNAWEMNQSMYLQYVANPFEGGRGMISVASDAFEAYELDELALKFEVYVPKEIGYKGIKTEIFFGPIDASDKHGRDRSAICFWEPYKENGTFSTDTWKTITIPLTEFNHTSKTDEANSNVKINLKEATNFSFLQFGAPTSEEQIFMCVDNFRIVPIK